MPKCRQLFPPQNFFCTFRNERFNEPGRDLDFIKGDYLIQVFEEQDVASPRVYKIVTNDEHETHIDAPRLYDSLTEAMNPVDELDPE